MKELRELIIETSEWSSDVASIQDEIFEIIDGNEIKQENSVGILKSTIESMREQFRTDNEILKNTIETLRLTIEHGKRKNTRLVLDNIEMKGLLRRILPKDEEDWDKIIQQDSLYIDVKNFFRSFKSE